MEVVSSKPVSVSFVKDELEERSKEGELGYEQAQALEHANKVCSIKQAKLSKLVDELKKKKIPEESAVKIVDVMPTHISTLKALLLREKVEMSDEDLEGIIKILKK